MIKGIGVSGGIAIGSVKILKEFDSGTLPKIRLAEPAVELTRIKNAVVTAVNELEEIRLKVLAERGAEDAAIFEAHQLMLKDPSFIKKSEKLINEQHASAEFAFFLVSEAQVKKFENMEDAYFKERAADIKDITKRVMNILMGKTQTINSQGKSIIVASEVTPSQMAAFDTKFILAVITEFGGETAHSAMIARSREIPAVYGIGKNIQKLQENDTIIVDGKKGIVLINPPEATITEYKKMQEHEDQEKKELLKIVGVKAKTKNGKNIDLMANMANDIDLAAAIKFGAEGIGLLRTEFLLMDRTEAPTEEEQFLFYKNVVTSFPNHSTTIRTFDMGGDKPVPYLNMPKEENPFLGVRAIRLCLKECNVLFQSQLRAILRASAFGKCKIMIPMITTLEEIMAVKENLERAKAELKKSGTPFDNKIQLGIMIETPAAAIMADVLAYTVDFFSIGTNDLIQYVMAADRQNASLNELSHFYNPSVFRMISLVSNAAKYASIEVSVCGSMARDKVSILALLSCGIEKLSMGPSHLLPIKKFIAKIDTTNCEKVHSELLLTKTKEEYLSCLNRWEQGQ